MSWESNRARPFPSVTFLGGYNYYSRGLQVGATPLWGPNSALPETGTFALIMGSGHTGVVSKFASLLTQLADLWLRFFLVP